MAPRRLVLVNKRDLPLRLALEELAGETVLSVSARTGEGLSELEAAVAALFPAGEAPEGQLRIASTPVS